MPKKENLPLYQWERFVANQTPERDIAEWDTPFGPIVTSRNPDKTADRVRFRVLVDNPESRVFLVGPFNNWGHNAMKLLEYEMEFDEHYLYAELTTDAVSHGDRYKYLLKQDGGWIYLQDPAGTYFDDEGNTIFWDFDDPTTYKLKHGFIDTINRTTRILQTDLPGLITEYTDKDGRRGKDIDPREYYRFIADSGVLEKVKELGFNTIQFLPFAQSIDGKNWKYRYLVPFQFAIQKNWGSPDDFAYMIDRCHELGIAVIGDFVLGHLPFKDFNIFGQPSDNHGIHPWKNRHGYQLYMKEETPWGTMRVDFDNPEVRSFFISSCVHFLKRYRVDGLRIDNVDGIMRFGPNGDGEERPNGRRFLRELNSTIYGYNPNALIHVEAHYFHGDNAKMLVVPFEEDERAIGATAYNSSRMSYYFHKEYMPKDAKKITPWRFRDIASEKEWGQSNSTIADFHNHDAAAGLIEMRCTGSYAYDAMTYEQPHVHAHAMGKIKVMEAIISFVCEGRTLDLLQTFLLQKGTFEHDPSIHWHLLSYSPNSEVAAYKRRVNEIMESPALWPIASKNRRFLNVDDNCKVLVVERSDEDTPNSSKEGASDRLVAVINLSGWEHHKYKVGVRTTNDYEIILWGDAQQFGGEDVSTTSGVLRNRESSSFEVLDREVELEILPPYGVVVLREKKA